MNMHFINAVNGGLDLICLPVFAGEALRWRQSVSRSMELKGSREQEVALPSCGPSRRLWRGRPCRSERQPAGPQRSWTSSRPSAWTWPPRRPIAASKLAWGGMSHLCRTICCHAAKPVNVPMHRWCTGGKAAPGGAIHRSWPRVCPRNTRVRTFCSSLTGLELKTLARFSPRVWGT